MHPRTMAAYGVALVCLFSSAQISLACFRQIAWGADLSSGSTHAGYREESGSAQMQFDFQQPFGALIVKTRNVSGVESIALRRVRWAGDLHGPIVAWIYQSKDGPYHGAVTKLLRQSDVIPLAHPINDGYTTLADELVHRRIVVAVNTKSHPQGEVEGLITGRLVVVYSSGGSFHDPKLHQQLGAGGI